MKILVAIDGSKNSLRALKHAIKLAGKMAEPCRLLLANAHDDAAMRGATQFLGKQAVDGYLKDLADEQLKDAIEVATKAGVDFGTLVLRGQPGIAIAEAGNREECDLIVLGAKGRTALKDLLLGSVAQRVVAVSKVPVLLVS